MAQTSPPLAALLAQDLVREIDRRLEYRTAPRSASVGSVRQRRNSPLASPIAAAIFVPPMSSATTALASSLAISVTFEHDRADEEAWVIGVDIPSRRELLNGAVDADETC